MTIWFRHNAILNIPNGYSLTGILLMSTIQKKISFINPCWNYNFCLDMLEDNMPVKEGRWKLRYLWGSKPPKRIILCALFYYFFWQLAVMVVWNLQNSNIVIARPLWSNLPFLWNEDLLWLHQMRFSNR